MLSRAKLAVIGSLEQIGIAVRRHRDPWEAQTRLLAGRPVETIFDLGANVGDVTARYRELFPTARIYAFEPAPECLNRLRSRFSDDSQVTIVPKGVSSEVGEQTLYLSGGPATHSLLERPKTGRAYHQPHATVKGTVSIELTTLDAVCDAHDIQGVDLLKIDVEGSEIATFRGATRLLAEQPPPVIVSEVMFVPHLEGQPLYFDIAAHLAEYGYSLFDLYELHHTTSGQLRWGNAIFVSAEQRAVVDRWP